MMKSIDLKSFLIGGLLVLVVLCVLGAMPRLSPPGPVGRYALVVPDLPGDNSYVIDTTTGQVWQGRTDAFYAPKLQAQAPAEPNKPNTR